MQSAYCFVWLQVTKRQRDRGPRDGRGDEFTLPLANWFRVARSCSKPQIGVKNSRVPTNAKLAGRLCDRCACAMQISLRASNQSTHAYGLKTNELSFQTIAPMVRLG